MPVQDQGAGSDTTPVVASPGIQEYRDPPHEQDARVQAFFDAFDLRLNEAESRIDRVLARLHVA